jgi:CRISPR-associated protein Cst2
MAFITGLILIDAPAAALNNGEGEDIKGKVKSIHVRGQGDYPYVSAQSFRYWLRTTLESKFPAWQASPVYSAGASKKQQAYTVGDPIRYWDDDLLGYMRAEKTETITRVSPFRTGTVVSIAPVQLVADFGVMARAPKEEGDKQGVLLHGHEFYRAVLQAFFSLDLAQAGTFTNQRRTGFQNLGQENLKGAESQGLTFAEHYAAYRLPVEQRIQRIQTLLRALGRIEGGAKQTLHYTDVTPAFVIAAVTRGGNHIFGRVVTTTSNGQPTIHAGALDQALTVFTDDLLSSVYIGRAEGFMENAAEPLAQVQGQVMHPRQALDALAADLAGHPEWLD